MSTNERILMHEPADTVAGAYFRGYHEGTRPELYSQDDLYAPHPMRRSELQDAVDSWTAAQSDHGHTSFWGVQHIRIMRAYWIGRMRAARFAR